MRHIAIFASGAGTNAENIINHFRRSNSVKIDLVLSNRMDAGVLERSAKHQIDTFVFNRNQMTDGTVLDLLRSRSIDYIVLAGFLWLLPKEIIDAYSGRIINIHPALLPAYGGKGMYGDHVHQAVVAAGEQRSGITVHLVNEHYDSGDILLQAYTNLTSDDTPHSLAQRIHRLEYRYFPQVIEAEVSRIFSL